MLRGTTGEIRWASSLLVIGVITTAGCNGTNLHGDPDATDDTGLDTGIDGPSDIVTDSTPLDTIEDATDTTGDPPADVDEEEFVVPPYDPPPTCDWFEVEVFWPTGETVYSHDQEGLYASGHEPIMHVIAVHQAESGDGGVVQVTVQKTYRPVILVLASTESVEWILVIEDGADIQQILMFGDAPSTISGAEAIPLFDTSGATTFEWDHCWPMCDNESGSGYNLVAQAQYWTGVEASTFDGCQEGSEIVLRHQCREDCDGSIVCEGRECGSKPGCPQDCGACSGDLACIDGVCVECTRSCSGRECGSDGCDGSCGSCSHSQECESGVCEDIELFAGCESVAAESLYCLTILDEGAALVGLDSGTLCELPEAPGYLGGYYGGPSNVAWDDGRLYLCNYGRTHGLMRVSFVDGSWDLAETGCDALAMYEGGPLIVVEDDFSHDDILWWFASFRDIAGAAGTEISRDIWAMNMAVAEDLLYYTRFSAGTVDVLAMPSGEEEPRVLLEGFDGHLNGFAATGDGRLVVADDEVIVVFGASSGAYLFEVDPDQEHHGLVCWTNL